ncbi:hypothetical protein Mc24_04665 [Thermotoga sp. Mc24]|nr:hypothetical protein Mc24_04665 [Thermotoga sp. Mc24]
MFQSFPKHFQVLFYSIFHDEVSFVLAQQLQAVQQQKSVVFFQFARHKIRFQIIPYSLVEFLTFTIEIFDI